MITYIKPYKKGFALHIYYKINPLIDGTYQQIILFFEKENDAIICKELIDKTQNINIKTNERFKTDWREEKGVEINISKIVDRAFELGFVSFRDLLKYKLRE